MYFLDISWIVLDGEDSVESDIVRCDKKMMSKHRSIPLISQEMQGLIQRNPGKRAKSVSVV